MTIKEATDQYRAYLRGNAEAAAAYTKSPGLVEFVTKPPLTEEQILDTLGSCVLCRKNICDRAHVRQIIEEAENFDAVLDFFADRKQRHKVAYCPAK